MAGRILKDDIDGLRDRADIVAIVGDHTKLKRAGQRWKGLCPFHSEKTPSFTVDPGTNLYYCFGCSEGGDIYDFLMRVEGLDFVESVEQLARRTGYTLRYEEMSAREKRALGERSRMIAVNQAAQEFFTAALFSAQGEVARDYLKQRGFTREDAETFALGFAPNEWDALARHLTAQKGFAKQDVLGVRLARPNERGGLRDTFRGRLVFPVRDLSGDPIGFGGRVLPALDYGDFTPPKYLNSPEYRLYQKHKVLYGLYEARPEVVKVGQVLVCEGYTDVMALHQAGFANAVATCGTAVGEDHFRLLARYADRIVLAFDADAAGVKAATRAWEAARSVEAELGGDDARHGFELHVLILPEGRDPADVVRGDGVDALRELAVAATPVVPFLIRDVVRSADLSSEAGRTAALKTALALLGDETDPELRRAYARSEIAAPLGVSIEFVQKTAARQGVELDVHQGIARIDGRASGERGAVVRSDVTKARTDRERRVLRVALQSPALLPDEWSRLTPQDFAHPRAQALMATIIAVGGAGAPVDAVLAAASDDEQRDLIQRLAVEDFEVEPVPAGVLQDVRAILADRVSAQIDATQAELALINMQVDPESGLALQRRLLELEQQRRALRELA